MSASPNVTKCHEIGSHMRARRQVCHSWPQRGVGKGVTFQQVYACQFSPVSARAQLTSENTVKCALSAYRIGGYTHLIF